MLQPVFQPFPELTTERLLLRRVTMEDALAIFFLRSDETVLQFISREPAKTIQEAEEFIKRIDSEIDANEVILWAIALRDDPGKLIGTICYWQLQKENYRAEIGFVLHPHYWRKGIMKEAVLKVIEYGFSTLRLHSIEAHINSSNTASAAILESTGFVREAYLKENVFFGGKFLDTAIYSRLH